MANKRISAIIIETEKILLVHRIKPGKDYFVLPGGSVEAGETDVEALIREVKEETSLEISIEKLLWKINDRYDERTQYIYLIFKFTGKLELGSPEKERQSENNKYVLEWHDLNDLKTVNFFPSEVKTNILNTFLDNNT